MTTRQQIERDQIAHNFTFTLQEVKYLATIQALVEERLKQDLLKPTEAQRLSFDDLVLFGKSVREAVANGVTTLPIKVGVAGWLNIIGNRMRETAYKEGEFNFPAGATKFTKQDAKDLFLRLVDFHADNR